MRKKTSQTHSKTHAQGASASSQKRKLKTNNAGTQLHSVKKTIQSCMSLLNVTQAT